MSPERRCAMMDKMRGRVDSDIVYDGGHDAFGLPDPRAQQVPRWKLHQVHPVTKILTCPGQMRRLISAALGGLAIACETDWDCSLNGVCGADGACACDAPWGGPACGRLLFAPGAVTACGAECAYHGPNVTSVATTTWGASVPVSYTHLTLPTICSV